jgi:hypothetical protein
MMPWTAPLQAHRAFDRIDDAAELCQEAIAHKLEDTTMVAGDFGFKEFFSSRSQALEGPLFVLLH